MSHILGPSNHAIAVDTLLERLADELRRLAGLARDIPGTDCASDREAFAAAQKQDLLEQTLEELATFLHAGRKGIEAQSWLEVGPALAEIRLSALAARLKGASVSPDERSGDVDFF